MLTVKRKNYFRSVDICIKKWYNIITVKDMSSKVKGMVIC